VTQHSVVSKVRCTFHVVKKNESLALLMCGLRLAQQDAGMVRHLILIDGISPVLEVILAMKAEQSALLEDTSVRFGLA
jgi:hypothetical protein